MMFYGYNGYDNYGTYNVLSVIITILIWVVIIGVIIAIIRAVVHSIDDRREHHPPRPIISPTTPITRIEKTPLDILNERYARGEINKEEFDQKKMDILGHL